MCSTPSPSFPIRRTARKRRADVSESCNGGTKYGVRSLILNSEFKIKDLTPILELVEGRRINRLDFITQYFAARDVVNRLKTRFGSNVRVDLLHKNTDNSHRLYKAGVDQIDNHIPEKYKRTDLEKLLGLV